MLLKIDIFIGDWIVLITIVHIIPGDSEDYAWGLLTIFLSCFAHLNITFDMDLEIYQILENRICRMKGQMEQKLFKILAYF